MYLPRVRSLATSQITDVESRRYARPDDTMPPPSPFEPPRLVERLKLALAIGREQRADFPKTAFALGKARPCSGITPTLEVGVMTAPSNVGRRRRMRAADGW